MSTASEFGVIEWLGFASRAASIETALAEAHGACCSVCAARTADAVGHEFHGNQWTGGDARVLPKNTMAYRLFDKEQLLHEARIAERLVAEKGGVAKLTEAEQSHVREIRKEISARGLDVPPVQTGKRPRAAAGNAAALIAWYEGGADGAIDWGQPGDFEQCVAVAGKHLDNPEGFCQERHMAVTGEPAGKGAHQGAAKESKYHKLHRHLAQAGRHLMFAGLLGAGEEPEDEPATGEAAENAAGGDSDDAGAAQASARTAAVKTQPFSEPFPVPEYPPADWFGPPTWVDEWRKAHNMPPAVESDGKGGSILRLTVTDDGRVGGWFYNDGVCLVDGTCSMRANAHDCWMPGPSPTGYQRFHQQDVVTADGTVLQVGVIGNVGGHASEYVSHGAASAHYANPDAQMMIVRSGDDGSGGWIAGSVVPGSTYRDAALLRRSSLSGDWRWFAPDALNPEGGYDCLGPTLVNRPGLALVQVRAASAAHPDYLTPSDALVGARVGAAPPPSNADLMKTITSLLGVLPTGKVSGPSSSSIMAARTALSNALVSAQTGKTANAVAALNRASIHMQNAASTEANPAAKSALSTAASTASSTASGVPAAGKGGGKKGGGGKGKKGGGGKAAKPYKPPSTGLKPQHGDNKSKSAPPAKNADKKLAQGYHYVFGKLVGPDGKVVQSANVASALEAIDMSVIDDMLNHTDALPEDARFAITAAAIGSTDLPIAAVDHPWDAEEASARVKAWAGAHEKPNSRFGRAYLFKNPEESGFGAYKMQMCDIVGGKLTVIPAAIEEAANGLDAAGLGENDLPAVRGRIETLYQKIGGAPPWAPADQQVQAASASSEEVVVQLPDGTTLHFGTEAEVETLPDGTINVRTAALPTGPSAPTASDVASNATSTTDQPDDESSRLEAVENRMNTVEAALGEIMEFIQSQVEAQTASVQMELAQLDADERERAQQAAAAMEAVTEPPNPHVQINGTCVYCATAGRSQCTRAAAADDMVKCPTCDGEGKIKGGAVKCPDCGGAGEVTPAKAKALA